ncbi:hypothetical protein BDZ97DRAFT_1962593 [Flammula alnicola]|nr:hypothetical protein BDZ97DRAFT_1962593 [Flammula alnicola]
MNHQCIKCASQQEEHLRQDTLHRNVQTLEGVGSTQGFDPRDANNIIGVIIGLEADFEGKAFTKLLDKGISPLETLLNIGQARGRRVERVSVRKSEPKKAPIWEKFRVRNSDVPAPAWPESPGFGPALGGSGLVKSRAGPKAGNQAWPGPALAQAGALLTN